MPEINKPSRTKHWIAIGNGVVHIGKTNPNQVTTTGLDSLEPFNTEEDRFDALDPADLPQLPDVGRVVEEQKAYRYRNRAVISKSPHVREQNNNPDLFVGITRAPDWVARERISVGDERQHLRLRYVALVGHISQEPPNTPVPEDTLPLWSLLR